MSYLYLFIVDNRLSFHYTVSFFNVSSLMLFFSYVLRISESRTVNYKS